MTDKSPVQQGIEHWQKQAASAKSPEFRYYAELFIGYLESLLPTEKEFAGKVWDAADAHADERQKYPYGKTSEWEHPSKQQLLDKYYKP